MKKIGRGLKWAFLPVAILFVMLLMLFPDLTEKTDFEGYDNSKVMESVHYFASEDLLGRMTGTEGNEKAMAYVREAFKAYGLKPISDMTGYDQPFMTMAPDFQQDPVFEVPYANGLVTRYLPYHDYRMYSFGPAGTADYKGEFVFVDNYLYKVPVESIKGKIVVMAAIEFAEELQDYLIDAEVAGVLVYFDTYWGMANSERHTMKSTSFFNKNGPTIPLAAVSKKLYQELKTQAALDPIVIDATYPTGTVFGYVPDCTWHHTVDFQTVKTANILGFIEGKTDEVVIVSAHLDHVGEGVKGEYFPGALDNASGLSMVLELARLSSMQKVKPEKTMVFAAFNAEEVGLVGSAYYAQNPVFPLEKTQVINLDMIGGYNAKAIEITGLYEPDLLLASRYGQYAKELGFEVSFGRGGGSDHASFSEEDAPAVVFSQGMDNYHRKTDVALNVSPKIMAQNGKLFTTIIEKDIYGEFSLDFLTAKERFVISAFLLGLLLIYGVEGFKQSGEAGKYVTTIFEAVYYSPVYLIIKKVYGFLSPVLLLMLLLGVLTQLPMDFNRIQLDQQSVSNFSPYLTLKKTTLYYRELFYSGFGKTFRGSDAMGVIGKSFIKSGKLLLFSLMMAIPLGIIKGFFDVYGGKAKRELRAFGSIFLLSIPDLMWILLAFFITVQIGKQDLGVSWLKGAYLRGWIMPLITLSILPIVYISRIALVAAEEELSKPYIRALRAKGLSKGRIYAMHLTKPLLIKVFDSLAGLTTVMISNLILIEYLFDYKGIVSNILIYARNEDINTFIGLVLALGLMYVLCLVTFKGTSFVLNPKKQEVQS
jgi:ABC-type dipeptide/oligopeptide/nickel transport system permease component